jgi:hypothetical protein
LILMGVWRDPLLVRSHELKKRARAERCRWNTEREALAVGTAKKSSCP